MKLTNLQIYTYSQSLNSTFTDPKQYLPIRVNFSIQKNAQTLLKLYNEIEQSKMLVFQQYGDLNIETGLITVPEEKQQIVAQELNSLLDIEQEVNILTIKLQDCGDNLSLSLEQMNAIMFMIEED